MVIPGVGNKVIAESRLPAADRGSQRDRGSCLDRPQQFLALHFAIGVWDSNIGEVMGHPGTHPAVFERVLKFAEEIGLVPIPIRTEQNGYIITLWCPRVPPRSTCWVRGVSDFQSIDRTWMMTLQTGMGPCGMMDRMGGVV